ncbi:mucin-2-like [Aplysia californica]|uniref:Mucin-2-like n=1 Tax=Aplysia californica TaxID=6500 RepID=A0ABM0JTK9_APLCA|nr:mucin-2-like [Aplysia californica]
MSRSHLGSQLTCTVTACWICEYTYLFIHFLVVLMCYTMCPSPVLACCTDSVLTVRLTDDFGGDFFAPAVVQSHPTDATTPPTPAHSAFTDGSPPVGHEHTTKLVPGFGDTSSTSNSEEETSARNFGPTDRTSVDGWDFTSTSAGDGTTPPTEAAPTTFDPFFNLFPNTNVFGFPFSAGTGNPSTINPNTDSTTAGSEFPTPPEVMSSPFAPSPGDSNNTTTAPNTNITTTVPNPNTTTAPNSNITTTVPNPNTTTAPNTNTTTVPNTNITTTAPNTTTTTANPEIPTAPEVMHKPFAPTRGDPNITTTAPNTNITTTVANTNPNTTTNPKTNPVSSEIPPGPPEMDPLGHTPPAPTLSTPTITVDLADSEKQHQTVFITILDRKEVSISVVL